MTAARLAAEPPRLPLTQIDPFGHSSAHASLFNSPLSGMTALFISRAECVKGVRGRGGVG